MKSRAWAAHLQLAVTSYQRKLYFQTNRYLSIFNLTTVILKGYKMKTNKECEKITDPSGIRARSAITLRFDCKFNLPSAFLENHFSKEFSMSIKSFPSTSLDKEIPI